MNKITQAVKSLIPDFNLNISGVSTDSRNMHLNDLFIPLAGKNFDGHNYINNALKNGANSFIYSHNNFSKKNGFRVDDTLKFYQALALEYANLLDAKKIAITGSTGKTTLKDILHNIFINADYRTHSTFGNENNLIGVPKTILSCPENADILIVEMGTNSFGEIKKETEITNPHISAIINIGPAHLEYFNDLDGVFKEKKALLDLTLGNKGIVVLPQWEKYFQKYKGQKNTHFIGVSENDKIKVSLDNKNIFSFNKNNINLYFKENIALAGGIASILHINTAIIEKTIKQMHFPRLKELNIWDKVIIDDAYNANPVSFKKSIDFTLGKSGKKGIVLGKIFELGKMEKHYEEELVSYIEKKDFSIVILKKPFKAKIPSNWFSADSNKEIVKIMSEHRNDFDTLLIKGSHGTELYKLVDMLKEL